MREGLTRHQPRFPAPVSVNLTSPGRPSVVCASDWAGAPCRWTTTYGYANAIERLWAGLESNLRKPGLRPVAGLLSHPPQQADCARTKNSQSALCRRYSPEGRSEETIGLPNWHTGVGRPSQGGAYRFRRWRYGLVREPRSKGVVGAHQHQWGVANHLVADHRPVDPDILFAGTRPAGIYRIIVWFGQGSKSMASSAALTVGTLGGA